MLERIPWWHSTMVCFPGSSCSAMSAAHSCCLHKQRSTIEGIDAVDAAAESSVRCRVQLLLECCSSAPAACRIAHLPSGVAFYRSAYELLRTGKSARR